MNLRQKFHRTIYMVTFLLGTAAGILLMQWPITRAVLADEGHALIMVANRDVQDAVLDVVHKYAGLDRFMLIESGPTHQVVLTDAMTVISTTGDSSIPSGRTFVIDDNDKRYAAVHDLVARLTKLGFHDVKVIQPDPQLPLGTIMLVVSPTALPGGAIGFRPDNLVMGRLAPDEVRFLW